MDLLETDSERSIPFNYPTMVENGSMELEPHLFHLLSFAECIAKETDFDGDHSLGSIEEHGDFENKNGAFTPSNHDLTSLLPLSRLTDVAINPLSSPCDITRRSFVINESNITGKTDPFEPTPIGPCINVVRNVPLSSLLGAWASPPEDTILWPGVVSNDSEDVASTAPIPLATLSSININSHVSIPSSSNPINRKFQEEQWKQRFQDLLGFQ
jgi:hypothetical protein